MTPLNYTISLVVIYLGGCIPSTGIINSLKFHSVMGFLMVQGLTIIFNPPGLTKLYGLILNPWFGFAINLGYLIYRQYSTIIENFTISIYDVNTSTVTKNCKIGDASNDGLNEECTKIITKIKTSYTKDPILSLKILKKSVIKYMDSYYTKDPSVKMVFSTDGGLIDQPINNTNLDDSHFDDGSYNLYINTISRISNNWQTIPAVSVLPFLICLNGLSTYKVEGSTTPQDTIETSNLLGLTYSTYIKPLVELILRHRLLGFGINLGSNWISGSMTLVYILTLDLKQPSDGSIKQPLSNLNFIINALVRILSLLIIIRII